MRSACPILIAGVLLSSGCSALIAQSGADLSTLRSRQHVHEQFGEPSLAGRDEGEPFEDFCTRRKVSEPIRSVGLGMGIGMTFGVVELIAFPYELYLLGRRTLFGQDLRFHYDSAGNVTRVYLDGEPLSFIPKLDDSATEPRTTARAQSLDQH